MSTPSKATEISNPRRILAVSLADSAHHLSDFIRNLTGTAPTPALPQSDLTDTTTTTTSTTTATADQGEETQEQQQQQQQEPTLSGTTHPLPLQTPYYTASIPVWLDLISDNHEWARSFLAPEAKEVLEVLGGVVVVFGIPPPPLTASSPPAHSSVTCSREKARELITQVGRVVREGLGGWEWDGVGLAVGVSSHGYGSGGDGGDVGDGVLDEWEDLCAEWGLEFVHISAGELKASSSSSSGDQKGKEQKRNAFGERVGMARVLEALQANDWSGGGLGGSGDGDEGAGQEDDDDEDDDGDFDPSKLDFGFDKADFEGLRKAIWAGSTGNDDNEEEEGDIGEEDVERLERMMRKLQAVRDATAGLPEDQRKRMAARAVGEVMRELEG
ncbi:hypothetical protein VTJ49DRAFT_6415 [Mycothermus thermophilus]|uniref:Alpha and gamma adaptin binding protein p34 n=1 Tax=Humicola insolens TaxID=85995 RepID=A0ABR3VKK3_HUMIN